ncbi:hypothetical protein MHYP_G00277720 [Metynnis hypsauchen]
MCRLLPADLIQAQDKRSLWKRSRLQRACAVTLSFKIQNLTESQRISASRHSQSTESLTVTEHCMAGWISVMP